MSGDLSEITLSLVRSCHDNLQIKMKKALFFFDELNFERSFHDDLQFYFWKKKGLDLCLREILFLFKGYRGRKRTMTSKGNKKGLDLSLLEILLNRPGSQFTGDSFKQAWISVTGDSSFLNATAIQCTANKSI